MPSAEMMGELMMRAMSAVREATPPQRRREDFGVLVEEFTDVQVADSTSAQLEERLLRIASVVARSRNQRRERAKPKREEGLGHAA
ncbi:MAG: hypothetical protein INH41_14450 [Myxococcaceae bacterium]|nr:hypothetical protein [Myxococcaceae bacterium]